MATDVPALVPIDGVPRQYAWGSPTAIPELLGLPADGRPVAELWFGAHSDDPSPAHGTTLDELIAADPIGMLGTETVEQFGPRLPFLVKLLAADKALSIQVHPDLEQARAGFAREDEAGIPRDAPDRTYRDPNHKPELMCALTEFEALCGFRPVADTLRLLDAFGISELDDVRTLLSGPDGLRAAFTHLLTLAGPQSLAAAVTARAADLIDDASWGGPARAVCLAASDFPGDVGVVLTLLLNYVRLQPGEAIFLAAGNVHAYLRGLGVEVMANSDNVLRCGLTSKHVDVAELLRITDFSALPQPRVASERTEAAWHYPSSVADFTVTRTMISASAHVGAGPSILVCTDGDVAVTAGDATVALRAGTAAYLAATEQAAVTGTGTLFTATVN